LSNTKTYHFLLFVSGMSEKSVRAIENLRKIGDEFFPNDYEVEIIDISREPLQAANYEIIGIPTLIKFTPDPKRIILGDLSDREKVLRILNLD
jgi:circadian clock protein KaiB